MKKNLHIIIISFIFSVILWVSISLSNDYYATFDVPIKLVDFPSGYTTGSKIPKTVSIKLKGKGWKLIAVDLGSESDYVIPVGKDTGKRNINLYNYYVENQWLSSEIEVINISPDTLSFDVEKIVSKKLPIQPNVTFNFKPGYGLASPMSIAPESTTVYGPAKYLKELKSVPTEKSEFDGLDNKSVELVELKNMSGMRYRNTTVRLNLDVQKIVDKNFNKLFVRIVDVPRDRDVVLLPNRVDVAVRGGIDILGKLDTTQFNLYVN